jgi:hypothetical protein
MYARVADQEHCGQECGQVLAVLSFMICFLQFINPHAVLVSFTVLTFKALFDKLDAKLNCQLFPN